MPTQAAVNLYRDIRSKPDLMNDLMQIEVSDALIDRLNSVAEASGQSISRSEIGAGLSELPEIIQEVAGDELTDAELELVSGGGVTKVDA